MMAKMELGRPLGSISAAGGLPVLLGAPAMPLSLGSSYHGTGLCKPCAFFWKPEGCGKGLSCQHCHLCPQGELQTRKGKKLATAKQGGQTMGVMEGKMQQPATPADARAPVLDLGARVRAMSEPMSISLSEELFGMSFEDVEYSRQAM
jgi:hypothetical protein